MFLPDVNILVNAFRTDAEHHGICHSWLKRTAGGPSDFGILSNSLSGFLRIVTHSRIFKQPSPLSEAIGFCDTLLEYDNAVSLTPGKRHWKIFTDLCYRADARGNLIPDAWFAAVAIEHGCTWVTLDRDFSRFDGLRWSAPQ